MEAYSERRPSFSMANPHRHSSATLLDFTPLHEYDASGTSTPPLQTPASVPFKWEQEPGKPRPDNRIAPGPKPKPKPAKCLDPPPCRMPGSILDGPHNAGRPKFSSSRFFGEGNPDLVGAGRKGRGLFGKLKGGGKREIDGGGGGNSGNSFSSNSSCDCESDESCSGTAGAGSRKMRRHNSFSNLSHQHHRSPHIWATLYGGLKQVVHWKSTRK